MKTFKSVYFIESRYQVMITSVCDVVANDATEALRACFELAKNVASVDADEDQLEYVKEFFFLENDMAVVGEEAAILIVSPDDPVYPHIGDNEHVETFNNPLLIQWVHDRLNMPNVWEFESQTN